MIVVAILGILAAVAIPALIDYVRRSKTSEVANNLKTMYYAAKHYFDYERSDRNGANAATRCVVDETGAGFMEPATPGSSKQKFDPASHPSWVDMGYTIGDPVYYGYTFTTDKTPLGGTNCPAPGTVTVPGNLYSMRAHGNLDDDAILSTFEIRVNLTEVELARSAGMFIHLETE